MSRPIFHSDTAVADTPPMSTAGVIRNRRAMQAIATAAQQVARQDTPQRTMMEIVLQARSAVPGCDEAGITLERYQRRLSSPASTNDLAAACDAIELELGEGPCLDALRSNHVVRGDDLALDSRWPVFTRRASALGVKSLLAVPLSAPRGMFGALNLYADSINAFDEEAELIASTYAIHAAIAVMHAELESNLRVGLATREEIGRAVGILMERHRVTASAAFDMLVYSSQRSHRKLRYVATWVNETGEDPDKIAP